MTTASNGFLFASNTSTARHSAGTVSRQNFSSLGRAATPNRRPEDEKLFLSSSFLKIICGIAEPSDSSAWDGRGRLVSCETPQGERWAYGYDPFGRRLWKRRIATQRPERGPDRRDPPAPPIGTHYGWDGDLLSEEAPLAADGTPDWDRAVRWHYEPSTFRPLAREDADGRLLYVVTDHLGTPREMLDEAGELVWAAEYRVWGAMRRWWVAANDDESGGRVAYTTGNLALELAPAAHAEERAAAAFCPLRFQGQWADEETGLSYNRFRYYDAATAQYVSPDPIGLIGGLRRQGYVSTSTAWVDPLGLDPNFIVSPGGTAFPVPTGATGPTPVVNPAGKVTGSAYTGGTDSRCCTMRNMDPTPPRGASPGYPDGYVKYENAGGQGVDPYTGRTLPNSASHFPK